MSEESLLSTVRSVNVPTEPLRSQMLKNLKYAPGVRILVVKKLDSIRLSLIMNFKAENFLKKSKNQSETSLINCDCFLIKFISFVILHF
jgi:hypothetical protein